MNHTINTTVNMHHIFRLCVITFCFFKPPFSVAEDHLSVDVLYAATLNAKEVASNGKKMLIKQPQAVFPEFRADLDGQDNIVNSVKQGFNILHYDKDSGGGYWGTGYFLTRLNEFYDSQAASKDLVAEFAKASSSIKDANELKGQVIGDETRYLMGVYGDKGYFAHFAFFRVKNITGFVRINTQTPLATRNISDYLARYIAVLSNKVNLALNGRLPSVVLPLAIRDNLPSLENTFDLAKLLGTAVAPAEAWANIDSSGDFNKVKKTVSCWWS